MRGSQEHNFRDEVVWRGHMLAFSYVIRATIHEIAAWAAGVLFVYLLMPKFTWVAALVVATRMSYAYVQDWLRVNRVESDISDVGLKT
jgi:hypothetical protein